MTDPLAVFAAQRGIDLTAFLGTSPWRLQASHGVADLTRLADRLGLEGLCVSQLASVYGFDTRSGNEVLFEQVSSDDRLWAHPVINPSETGWEREMSWAAEAGARGVRVLPGYHGYRLTDPVVSALIDAVRDFDLPLHVSTILDDPRVRHPRYAVDPVEMADIADFLRVSTGVATVLSGLRTTDWDIVASHLDHGHDASRVLVDLWFVNGPAGVIADLWQHGMGELFAFGSCTPVQAAIATAYQVGAAAISEDQRRDLAGDNARRVLVDPTPSS